jgi:hypothetical protein
MPFDRSPARTLRFAQWMPRALRRDVGCLNGLDWRSVGLLFALAACLAIYSSPTAIFLEGMGLHATPAEYGLLLFGWFVRYLVHFGPILVALTIADNLPLAGRTRIAALVVALVIGAQLQGPIRCVYEPESDGACAHFRESPFKSLRALSQSTIWTIGFAMPLAFVGFSRRRELRVRRALHEAEVSRSELQRQTLEADLQGMQAQVEPAFLLDTLRHIGELCDEDPVTGALMLDELIVYLRAALPDLRATRSTLRRETALARAYLALLDLRAARQLDVEVDVDERILDAAMPAMILLPLLAGAAPAMRAGAAARVTPRSAPPASARSSLGFGARVVDENLRIEVTARGAGTGDLARTPLVADIRARLHSLYGERASIEVVSRSGVGATACLTIPHERL